MQLLVVWWERCRLLKVSPNDEQDIEQFVRGVERQIINNCLKGISTDILLGEVPFKSGLLVSLWKYTKKISRILRFDGEFFIIKKWVPIISGEG